MRQVGDDLRAEPGKDITFTPMVRPSLEWMNSQHYQTFKAAKKQEIALRFCSKICVPGDEGWTKETDACASNCMTKFSAAHEVYYQQRKDYLNMLTEIERQGGDKYKHIL